MANIKPSAARLRTTAAAIIVAAVVASCASERPREVTVAPADPASSPAPQSADDSAAGSEIAAAATSAPLPSDDIGAELLTVQPPVTQAGAAPNEPAQPLAAAGDLLTIEPARPELPDLTELADLTELPDLTGPAEPAAPAAGGVDLITPSLVRSISEPDHDVSIQAPNPVTIRIPRLDVNAPIIPLGLKDDGSIEVPRRTEETGWWLGGPEPGEPGPAVILGHIDSQQGPAVFHQLRYLEAGDEVHIDRVDGSTVSYVVDSSARHLKDEFPTDAVYGPTPEPTLRLVTCGGVFDSDEMSYRDNLIVFASLA